MVISEQFNQVAAAFAVESRNALRAEIFAKKAEKEGKSGLARFFHAAADSSSVRSRRLLLLMRGKIASDMEGLGRDFEAEAKEALSSYRNGIEADRGVSAAMNQFEKVEQRLLDIFRSLNQNGEDEKDGLCICQICGYPAQDGRPEKCPICGAISEKFKEII